LTFFGGVFWQSGNPGVVRNETDKRACLWWPHRKTRNSYRKRDYLQLRRTGLHPADDALQTTCDNTGQRNSRMVENLVVGDSGQNVIVMDTLNSSRSFKKVRLNAYGSTLDPLNKCTSAPTTFGSSKRETL